MQRHLFGVLAAVVVTAMALRAEQPPNNPNARQNFIKIDSPVVALTHVRVIDGTGAPARENQTIVIRDGRIAAVDDTPRVHAAGGANIIDLPGKTVIPGLVMMHEHLYYTTGPGVYGQLGESFSRLYLAGGVTTMRTGGNMNGIMDINLARPSTRASRPARPSTRRRRISTARTRQLQMHALERRRRRAAAGRRTGPSRARHRSRRTCRSRATS